MYRSWILRRGTWACVRQKSSNSGGVKKQLRVPGQVSAQGVHEEGGDRVLLQPIPQPAEGVAGGLEGRPGRLDGARVVPGDRHLFARGMGLADLHVRGVGVAEGFEEVARLRALPSSRDGRNSSTSASSRGRAARRRRRSQVVDVLPEGGFVSRRPRRSDPDPGRRGRPGRSYPRPWSSRRPTRGSARSRRSRARHRNNSGRRRVPRCARPDNPGRRGSSRRNPP